MTEPLNRADRRKADKKRQPTTVSSAASFKKNVVPIIQLPSGNRVRVKRPGMEKFLSAGFLPDPLADQVRRMIKDRTGKAEQSSHLQNADPDELMAYMEATDRIAAYCVVEPVVRWHKREASEPGSYEEIPEEERDSEIVYTDEMEMEDKMFVFQYAVGGTSDLNRFREATVAAVDALQSGSGVVETT